ncbi:MAG: hypothetical protein HY053_01185 [Proteobacteria bacterium]|nr:hypothetical protein [Pseudomonadota bacterium]
MKGLPPETFKSEEDLQAAFRERSAAISAEIMKFGAQSMPFYVMFQEAARLPNIASSTQIMDARTLSGLLKQLNPEAPPVNLNPQMVKEFSQRAQNVNNLALGGSEAAAEKMTGLLQGKPEDVPDSLKPYVEQVRQQLGKAGKERSAIADVTKFDSEKLKTILGKMSEDGKFGPTSRLAEQIARQHEMGLENGAKPHRMFGEWQRHSIAAAKKAGVERPDEPIFKDGVIQEPAGAVARAHIQTVMAERQKAAPTTAYRAAPTARRAPAAVAVPTPPPSVAAPPPAVARTVPAAKDSPARPPPAVVERKSPARATPAPRETADPAEGIGGLIKRRRANGEHPLGKPTGQPEGESAAKPAPPPRARPGTIAPWSATS